MPLFALLLPKLSVCELYMCLLKPFSSVSAWKIEIIKLLFNTYYVRHCAQRQIRVCSCQHWSDSLDQQRPTICVHQDFTGFLGTSFSSLVVHMVFPDPRIVTYLTFQCELEINTDVSPNTAHTKLYYSITLHKMIFSPANSFISDENIHILAYLTCWVSVLTGSLSMSPRLKLFPWERLYKERKDRRGSSVMARW